MKKKPLLILTSCIFVFAGCEEVISRESPKENTSIEKANDPNADSPFPIEIKSIAPFENKTYSELTEQKSETDMIVFDSSSPTNITYQIEGDEKSFHSKEQVQRFPNTYTDVEGVLTFRGNHLRNSPTYGVIPSNPTQLDKLWEFQTSFSPKWGGGAGWTGQPSIVKWSDEVREIMNIHDEFKKDTKFVEVVYASLDGHIYFLDLKTGKPTRNSIDIENPIKGSISIDPRGYPLLYVGQGIPETGNENIGFRIYSLIDGKMLHMLKGFDKFASRKWGAFDGAPLINRESDTLFLGGENGLTYAMKLNTIFSPATASISINPVTLKYRYAIKGNTHQGIENSVAGYKNMLFFTDNGGTLQGLNTETMSPVWSLAKTDDSDATIVVEDDNNVPYLYTGTEVDKQGSKGNSILRKVNGITGDIMWRKDIPALSILGENPVNGGLLATPILGSGDISDLAIFTIARYKTISGGLMIALDKKTGEERWRWETKNYAWSSPVSVQDEDGTHYILQSDSIGNTHLLKGNTGELLKTVNFFGTNIEASPAVYNDILVVANRGGQIFSLKIK